MNLSHVCRSVTVKFTVVNIASFFLLSVTGRGAFTAHVPGEFMIIHVVVFWFPLLSFILECPLNVF